MTCVALWDTVRHSIFHIRSCGNALHTEKYHIMQSIHIHTYTFYPAETAKVVCYFILELSIRCTTVEAVQP